MYEAHGSNHPLTGSHESHDVAAGFGKAAGRRDARATVAGTVSTAAGPATNVEIEILNPQGTLGSLPSRVESQPTLHAGALLQKSAVKMGGEHTRLVVNMLDQ